MVYSPLDALRIARENPDREVVFFAIGFETTAPSTALTLKRAKAEGMTNFSCVCNHVTIVPPLRALLESPDLRLDGFIGPGHVCTVVGARPFEFIPVDYGRPVVISGVGAAGHPQSILMVLGSPRAAAASREPVHGRPPAEGNPGRPRRWRRCLVRQHFDGAASGFISQSALRFGRLPGSARNEELRRPGVRVADPKDYQCGEVLKGVIKPWECKVLGGAGLSRARDRDLHGLARGGVRGVLQLRAITAREREADVNPVARSDRPPENG